MPSIRLNNGGVAAERRKRLLDSGEGRASRDLSVAGRSAPLVVADYPLRRASSGTAARRRRQIWEL